MFFCYSCYEPFMPRTVLTLTTSPQRMHHLPKVLDSIFNQLTSPDAVYLNLPKRYRNRDTYIIPDWLSDVQQLTLQQQGDDLGPVMKILPVLEYLLNWQKKDYLLM